MLLTVAYGSISSNAFPGTSRVADDAGGTLSAVGNQAGPPGLYRCGVGTARIYSFCGTKAGTIHAVMGCSPPQSKHLVTMNWAAQYGQTACVWNVSNDFPHCPHFQ